ncbi:tRNA-specific adenosine deaminase subunit tad3 [Tilletia horrida]|uniref:tRNA-specific adenosine deaminase subunit tad3 n=1 Tax=Tilletia horrida TaxID=155126 RepID=A0AAN6GXI1_9BASI|nr:tRNA-specific adenosine deaminase subunit tad3 [Tilletia horrida]
MRERRLETPPPSSSGPTTPTRPGADCDTRVSDAAAPFASFSTTSASAHTRAQKRRRTNGAQAIGLSLLSHAVIDPCSSPRSCIDATRLEEDAGPSSQPDSSQRLTVKGNVTPSRASDFFRIRSSQAQQTSSSSLSAASLCAVHDSRVKPVSKTIHASPRTVLHLTTPTPRRLRHTFDARARIGDTYTDNLLSRLRRPPPAASASFVAGNPAITLAALRTQSNPLQHGTSLLSAQVVASRSLYSRPIHSLNTRSYLNTFSSREDLDWYELESSLISPGLAPDAVVDVEERLAHPLCCAYSYSSKAAEPNAQWLAIGDNEGRIVLLNTLDDSTTDAFTASPQWRVHNPSPASGSASRPGTDSHAMHSVFELAWRHDDVLLASGSSNYRIAVWDVSSQSCTELFAGPGGSARSIQWDPDGAGHLLCSGGRDGAIHLYDRRVRPHESGMTANGDFNLAATNQMPDAVQPVLSIWGAHTSSAKYASKNVRSGKSLTTRGGKSVSRASAHRGVTALAYLPGRKNCIVSAGCEDGRLRVWDWRALGAVNESDTLEAIFQQKAGDGDADMDDADPLARLTTAQRSERQVLEETDRSNRGRTASDVYTRGLGEDDDGKAGKRSIRQGKLSSARMQKGSARRSDQAKRAVPQPIEESLDVSRRYSQNKSSHGVSSLAVGNNTIFAACTDANIYALNASDLVAGLPVTSSVVRQASVPSHALYNPMQRGNTLFAKIALDPQEQVLAVGCNSGKVVLYDVKSQGAGFGIDGSNAVVLQGGHLANSEMNGVSWAHGPQGPTLATIADDFTVRTWRPDRAFSERMCGDGVLPLELGSDEEFEWEMKARKVWRGGDLDDCQDEMAWSGADSDEEDGLDSDFDVPVHGTGYRHRFAYDTIDPNTVPLQVRQAWVLRLPSPPSSGTMPALQKFLKVLQREHGADALRHLKTIRKADAGPSEAESHTTQQMNPSESTLEAVLAYRSKAGMLAREDSLLRLLEIHSPALLTCDSRKGHEDTSAKASNTFQALRLQDVPTTHIPTRDRVAEWNALWPCVLRMTGPAPASGKASKSSTSSKSGADAGAKSATASLTSSSAAIDFVDRAQDARLWVETSTSTKSRLQWAVNNLKRCVQSARQARERGDLPIAAHVSVAFEVSGASLPDGLLPLSAHDTRKSSNHPLRHAVLNAIRAVADGRAAQKLLVASPGEHSQGNIGDEVRDKQQGQTETQTTSGNGQDYLLNTLSLFTTHEPCIFCTMALVHSRVRQVFFLLASPGSGGCCGDRRSEDYTRPTQVAGDEEGSRKDTVEGGKGGGPFALHEQSGLNHHFEVWRWTGSVKDAELDAALQELTLPGMNP